MRSRFWRHIAALVLVMASVVGFSASSPTEAAPKAVESAQVVGAAIADLPPTPWAACMWFKNSDGWQNGSLHSWRYIFYGSTLVLQCGLWYPPLQPASYCFQVLDLRRPIYYFTPNPYPYCWPQHV